MQRDSIVILVVLLCYVCVLNLVVANFLYRRYSPAPRPRAAANASFPAVYAAAASVRAAVATPAPPAEEPARAAAADAAPACAPAVFTDVAVRLRTLVSAESNDVGTAPAVRLLSALRERLLGSAHARVRVWLVLRPADFVALFRLWCVALGADSKGRCQCEVLFTEPAQHRAIAWLLAHRLPCAARLFVLDEGFQIPHLASFAPPAAAESGDRADSLNRADSASLQALDAGPVLAGRESMLLPGCFLRECVRRRCRLAPGLQVDADVAEFARGARVGLRCRHERSV